MKRNREGPYTTRRAALKTAGAIGVGIAATAERGRAAGTDDEGWPQFHHDGVNTGHNPGASGISDDAEARWRLADGWDLWHVTSVDGTVYASVGMGTFPNQFEGKILAVGAADGTETWAFTPEGRPGGAPVVSDGRVYFGANDETVYALDAATGTEAWRSGTSGFAHQVTVAGDVVYVGTSYHRESTTVHAFEASSGAELWTFDGRGGTIAAPAVAGNTVFVHSAAGSAHGHDSDTLHALDAADGSVEWSRGTAAGGRAAPVVSEGAVFLGDEDGTVYAFERDSGSERWRVRADAAIETTPVVADGTVYVGRSDSTVVALDASSGDRQWGSATGAGTVGLATDGDTVYVGSRDGGLYGLAAGSGRRRWQLRLEGAAQHPIVVGDRVYVGSRNGELYAFGDGG